MNITSLIEKFSNGNLTPLEVTKSSLLLAKSHNEIFIEICEKEALKAAEESTRRWSSNSPLSNLDGIPFSVKDLIDVEGYPTTRGSKLFCDIKEKNASIVQKLLDGGAILIGKTTLSEFAYSGLGINNNFGTPTITIQGNKHLVGGSSSGSAASIYEKIVSFSIGTDTAGSIRVPSSYSGLVGYRPSKERYNKNGVATLAATFDSVGTIGLSVKDIKTIDSILSKSSDRKKNYNQIVYDHNFIESLDIDLYVKDNFYRTIDQLIKNGIAVENIKIPSLRNTFELISNEGWLGSIESYSTYCEAIDSDDFKKYVDPFILNRLKNSNVFSSVQISKLYQKREELIQRLKLEIGDAIYLLPTTASTAPTLEDAISSFENFNFHNMNALKLTMIGSFLDNPGIAIPNGFDVTGLHTSILLSQCKGLDDELINYSLSIEPYI